MSAGMRRLALGLAVAALLAWLALRHPSDSGPDPRLVQAEFLAMGTLVSVTAWLDEDMPRAQGAAAVEDLEKFLHAFDLRWSAWGQGELGQINRALGTGKSADIPAPLHALFGMASRMTWLSSGAFDVRVGGLVRLWGFDDEAHLRSRPPAQNDIRKEADALEASALLGADRYGPAPSVQLDFGAIAKGYAADLAIERLKAAGIRNAIVNAGGNLKASGLRGRRPWRIGIRHPRPDEAHRILASLTTQGDEAVITSGDYERYFEFQGRRYHHILDPHSGYPAEGLQAVTVVYAEGAWADAASTALFVAGPEHWRELASKLGLDQVLVVDAHGRVRVTQKLAQRLEFNEGIRPAIVP